MTKTIPSPYPFRCIIIDEVTGEQCDRVINKCSEGYVADRVCIKHYQRHSYSGSYQLKPKEFRACEIDGCDRNSEGYNMRAITFDGRSIVTCGKHYDRFKAHGDPNITLIDRETKICVINNEDCSEGGKKGGRQWCRFHYYRNLHKGDPLAKSRYPRKARDLKDFLLLRIDKNDKPGCWTWTGHVNKLNGYGTARNTYAHILAYRVWVDDIAIGDVIHHTCSNHSCVNPDHLQAVKPFENTAEMLERRAYRKRISELEEYSSHLEGYIDCMNSIDMEMSDG
jgi:hypothetical protein